MTLRKKILVSNICMVMIPVLLTLMFWAAYVHIGGADLRPINRSTGNGDSLSSALDILFLYESGLKDMEWNTAPDGENGAGYSLSPDPKCVDEFEKLGFHLLTETDGAVLFSNMDELDRQLLDAAGAVPNGALVVNGKYLLIRDIFPLDGLNFRLTAVYSEERADAGVQRSLIPMYVISPLSLAILLILVVGSLALTTTVLTRWVNRSVLTPLEELKKGADHIGANDLDYRISYGKADEFGTVCNAFDSMRLRLKDAEQQREHFEHDRRELLQGVSHDLRSPLTSIKGYALGIKDGIADTEEKRTRYCDAILTRSEDLERLTESLSLLVRLADGGLHLLTEVIDLEVYLRRFLADKKSYLEENAIETELRTENGPAVVQLDVREMGRVFTNLLENTVRYRINTPSRVSISVSILDKTAEIRYKDNGPGVTAQQLPYLFNSFYRADEARTKPEQGSGLGLAVVRRIVEGHGGTVSAYLEDGLGIRITLPLYEGGNAS